MKAMMEAVQLTACGEDEEEVNGITHVEEVNDSHSIDDDEEIPKLGDLIKITSEEIVDDGIDEASEVSMNLKPF